MNHTFSERQTLAPKRSGIRPRGAILVITIIMFFLVITMTALSFVASGVNRNSVMADNTVAMSCVESMYNEIVNDRTMPTLAANCQTFGNCIDWSSNPVSCVACGSANSKYDCSFGAEPNKYLGMAVVNNNGFTLLLNNGINKVFMITPDTMSSGATQGFKPY